MAEHSINGFKKMHLNSKFYTLKCFHHAHREKNSPSRPRRVFWLTLTESSGEGSD